MVCVPIIWCLGGPALAVAPHVGGSSRWWRSVRHGMGHHGADRHRVRQSEGPHVMERVISSNRAVELLSR
jgi:hypothetical protein